MVSSCARASVRVGKLLSGTRRYCKLSTGSQPFAMLVLLDAAEL